MKKDVSENTSTEDTAIIDPYDLKTVDVLPEPAQEFITQVNKETEPCPCLFVVSGRQLGKIFHLNPQRTVLGRSMDADIVLYDNGISRKHAALTCQEDGTVLIEDLNSTNGVFVEEKKISSSKLVSGDRIRVGTSTILKYSLNDRLEEKFIATLYQSATHDPLTELNNKRSFFEHLSRESAWHKRHLESLALVLLDVDNFKNINDQYGHIVGDKVLIHMASILKHTSRAEDFLTRFGGDEFICVLRCTELPSGILFANRIIHSISSNVLSISHQKKDTAIHYSVSIGVACRQGDELNELSAFIQEADLCMLEAKQKGKNCVFAKEIDSPHNTSGLEK